VQGVIPEPVVFNQTWGDYNTNVIDYDYDYLPPGRLRLRINKITMQSITITLKVITITTAIIFVLKHLQNENKPICLVWCKYILTSNHANWVCFTFSWPAESNRPSSFPQLLHYSKHIY